jgi:prepilin-type N-terminal cleavage/methylation domain-containing protein
MSVELGARNRKREGRGAGFRALCRGWFLPITRHAQPATRRRTAAFTLVELLVVVAIIGVLSSLMVPAMRGLVGVGGRRGGMNTLSSTIEQARLAAIENGTTVYVGFPFSAADPAAGYSSVIVYRDKRDDETNNAIVPLSRWLRMPSGVFIESDDLEGKSVTGALLPKLASSNGVVAVTQLSTLTFDRFGRLKPDDETAEIRVGEKSEPTGQFLQNDDNHFRLEVQPLTGRVIVEDRAAKK